MKTTEIKKNLNKFKSNFFSILLLIVLALVVSSKVKAQCNPFSSFTYAQNNNIVTFSGISTGTNVVNTYYSFGDGNYSSQVNTSHTYTSNGTYTVSLTTEDDWSTATSSATCFATYYDTIHVTSLPTPCNSNADFNYTAVNDTVVTFNNLSTSTNGIASYSWNFGDGNTSTLINPIHTYKNSGYYNICLTIVDSSGNCADTYCYPINIYIPVPCLANASYSFTTNNGLASFNNLSTSGNSGNFLSTWDFGDGNVSAQENPIHTYANPGNYTVCLTITNTSGQTCTSLFCDTITINSVLPCNTKAFFNYTDNNGFVSFNNLSSSSNGFTSLWYFNDWGNEDYANATKAYSSQTNPTYNYYDRYHYVTLTVVDNNGGCSATHTEYLNLNIFCKPYFYVDTNTFDITLSDGAFWGNYSYFWDFGDGTTSTQYNPTHSYSGAGPYKICLTISDPTQNCMSMFCDTIGNNSGTPIIVDVKSLTNSTTSINDKEESIGLLENYPNPFNEGTTIVYEINKNAIVELSVFDLLGKKIEALDSGNKTTGKYQITWNPENLSPGMYFINLKVDNNIITKKVIKQ